MAEGGPYWTKSWNPIVGCKGCELGEACWAIGSARRQTYAGEVLTADRRRWNGTIKFLEERLKQPLSWREPQVVAVCFMGDLAWAKPAEIGRVFDVMAAAQRHQFLVLTKEPARLGAALRDGHGAHHVAGGTYLPNVWMGVSASRQVSLHWRATMLCHSPIKWAGPKWGSFEPCRGPIDCGGWLPTPQIGGHEALEWIVAGSADTLEHGGQQFSREIARSLRDQCAETQVPFWLKQAAWDDFSETEAPSKASYYGGRAFDAPRLNRRRHREAPERIAEILRARGKDL